MGVFVRDFTVLIVLRREANVAFLIEPDGQGVPVGDEDPLSDVKLEEVTQLSGLLAYFSHRSILGGHHQRILNVLLDNPRRILVLEEV